MLAAKYAVWTFRTQILYESESGVHFLFDNVGKLHCTYLYALDSESALLCVFINSMRLFYHHSITELRQ